MAPCWRRYNHDGYGQKKDGGPYTGWGQGRAWPLLGGERAHYELAAGHDVKPLIRAFEQFSSIGGMLPEQVWDHADMPAEGMYEGQSAGSAQPLVWAHAEYLKLLRSVTDGKIFDHDFGGGGAVCGGAGDADVPEYNGDLSGGAADR